MECFNLACLLLLDSSVNIVGWQRFNPLLTTFPKKESLTTITGDGGNITESFNRDEYFAEVTKRLEFPSGTL